MVNGAGSPLSNFYGILSLTRFPVWIWQQNFRQAGPFVVSHVGRTTTHKVRLGSLIISDLGNGLDLQQRCARPDYHRKIGPDYSKITKQRAEPDISFYDAFPSI